MMEKPQMEKPPPPSPGGCCGGVRAGLGELGAGGRSGALRSLRINGRAELMRSYLLLETSLISCYCLQGGGAGINKKNPN